MLKVQNAAARLILRIPRHQRCTPLLQQLHWLPVSERIKYKTARMCYNSITGSAPSYLSELLQLYSPSRSLRSSSDTRPQTPTLQLQNSWLSLSPFSVLISGTTSPKISDTLILSFPSKTNSRHFSSLSISAEYYCHSPLQSV